MARQGLALPWVGQPATRRRGAIGGAIDNGDPAAEICLVAAKFGASGRIAGAGILPWTHDHGDHALVAGTLERAEWNGLVAERDRLRAAGAGIGIASCREPSGANSAFEPLPNAKNTTT
jgi:hypothetical protein